MSSGLTECKHVTLEYRPPAVRGDFACWAWFRCSIIPFLLYNFGLAGLFGDTGGDPFAAEAFSVTMMSGGVWTMSAGDLLDGRRPGAAVRRDDQIDANVE